MQSKVCGFALWSGQIRVKSEKPEEKKKKSKFRGKRFCLVLALVSYQKCNRKCSVS